MNPTLTTRKTQPTLLLLATLLIGCDHTESVTSESPGMPASFSPSAKVVRENGRIARCNTVHSMTLPTSMVDRFDLPVDPDTAVISCSLQIVEDGATVNLPAQVSGTATALSGNISQIDFKEVLEEETISYLGTFSIAARAGVRFDVTIVDPQTAVRYEIDFEQTEV